jgi:hypothetical protein
MTQSIQIPEAIMVNEENIQSLFISFMVRIAKAIKEGDPFCMISNWIFNNDKTEKQFRSRLDNVLYRKTVKSPAMVFISNTEDKEVKILTAWGVNVENWLEDVQKISLNYH